MSFSIGLLMLSVRQLCVLLGNLKEKVTSIVTFGAICSANNSYLDYLINSAARCSRIQIIILKVLD